MVDFELIYTEEPRTCIGASCDCWIAKTVDGVHYQTVHAARGDKDALKIITTLTDPRKETSAIYHKIECMFDALEVINGSDAGYPDDAQAAAFEVVVWVRREPATDDSNRVWGYRDMIAEPFRHTQGFVAPYDPDREHDLRDWTTAQDLDRAQQSYYSE